MNRDQFESLQEGRNPTRYIRADRFTGADRTLLYGYTCTRDTFHVYLSGGEIVRFVYQGESGSLSPVSYEVNDVWAACDLIPDKRTYPESTDVQFARMLQVCGEYVTYLPFDQDRYEKVRNMLFHGVVYGGVR